MSEDEVVASLRWNNYVSVVTITLICYEYLFLFDKEINFVWKRKWSLMSCLYLIVRYLGLFIALLYGCWGGLLHMAESSCYGLVVFMEWGFSAYVCFAEVILIWRLYALCSQSKLLLYVLVGLFSPIVALTIGMDIFLYSRQNAFSVKEVITPNVEYCAPSFNLGPMPAMYSSIPIICYDTFLLIVATAVLVKHLKERKEIKMKPNTYVLIIVRYHIIYFVLNLTTQIFLVALWANIPTPVMSLAELFNDTAPFVFAPRLIISIWDTHANENCVHVSTTFEDCVCWTSPPQHETSHV